MPTGNKEHDSRIRLEWSRKNPEKVKSYNRSKQRMAYQREYKKQWASIPENKIRLHKSNKEWRRRNPDKIRKFTVDFRKKRVEFINRFKMQPCMDCHMQYNPWVMHFDHRDPKIKTFGIARERSIALKKLEIEISKCDVVCANCHAERTHKQWKNGVLR
jgi:hypothetical protein